MTRSAEQKDLDRQALIETLTEHGRLRTKELIGLAQGVIGRDIDRIYAGVYADLAWLRKAGVVDSGYSYDFSRGTTWWLTGFLDADAEEDRREVERMMAGWEDAG